MIQMLLSVGWGLNSIGWELIVNDLGPRLVKPCVIQIINRNKNYFQTEMRQIKNEMDDNRERI